MKISHKNVEHYDILCEECGDGISFEAEGNRVATLTQVKAFSVVDFLMRHTHAGETVSGKSP